MRSKVRFYEDEDSEAQIGTLLAFKKYDEVNLLTGAVLVNNNGRVIGPDNVLPFVGVEPLSEELTDLAEQSGYRIAGKD